VVFFPPRNGKRLIINLERARVYIFYVPNPMIAFKYRLNSIFCNPDIEFKRKKKTWQNYNDFHPIFRDVQIISFLCNKEFQNDVIYHLWEHVFPS